MKRIVYLSILLFLSCSPTIVKNVSYDQNKYILWSDSRMLTWDDFEGNPINDSKSIVSEIVVYNPSNIERRMSFLPVQLETKALFDKKGSWINLKYSTDLLLKYNQVIFNIYELYSRKLKKGFLNSDFNLGNPIDIFNKLSTKNNDELLEILSKFRKESKFGETKDTVYKWYIDINNQIEELNSYK
jgi:hypothetical protein